MKMLITGATGFIGQKVLEKLKEKNVRNDNIVLLTDKKILGYRYIQHNNYHINSELFEETVFDTLIHLGALTPKGNGHDRENAFIENIRTTAEIADKLPVFPAKVVLTSTISVYRNTSARISETSPLTTDGMYALSKIVSEKYFINMGRYWDSDIQILRLGPIYGPGEESYNKIAGTFLKKAMNGDDIIVKSDGSEKRNMLLVDDVAEYICDAALYEKNIGTVNLVSTNSISVRELAELAVSICGSSSKIVVKNESKGRNDDFDAEKFQKIFGKYKVVTSYESGMKKLYHYLKGI